MTESEIIKGCQQKKRTAQEALVKQYAPMLMTVVRRYAPDQGTCWDILQESLIQIISVINQYQPKGSFEAWIRKVTIRVALKYVRKNTWDQPVVPLDLVEEASPMTPMAIQQLAAEDLLKLIRKLPDGFRQIFNLYVIEGYSHKEIAQLLDIQESTSRSQLTRARALLRQLIAQQEIV